MSTTQYKKPRKFMIAEEVRKKNEVTKAHQLTIKSRGMKMKEQTKKEEQWSVFV